MHSQENQRLKDLAKGLSDKLAGSDQSLSEALNNFEEEKAKRANLHNELQYSKMQLTKALEEAKAHQKKAANADRMTEKVKIMEELAQKLETKMSEQIQERKSLEQQHRELVMDLNGKINEKDQLIA